MKTLLIQRNRIMSIVLAGAVLGVAGFAAGGVDRVLPNVVIIYTDDQGYADVGCFGAKGFETPNLDRMAAEGMRFTDFYSAAPSCTPSRAALMTGCYPRRVSLPNVIGPKAEIGIHADAVSYTHLTLPTN